LSQRARTRGWAIAFVITLGLGLAPPRALLATEEASPAAVAAAESTFQRARELLDARKYEEAALAFQESHRQAPSVGALLNLGVCFEKLGRTASAWAAYKEAIKLARARSELAKVEKGEELLAGIEPTLSRLLIRPAEPTPGLIVRRGDVTLGAGSFEVPIPVDPGVVVLRAEAPQRAPREVRVAVEPGVTVEVDLPPLEPLPSPPPGGPAPPVVPPEGPPVLLVAGVVVGGVGVIGLAVGATLGALVLSERAELEDDPTLCPGRVCSAEGFERVTDLRVTATASTALWVGGGLLAAAGGTLIALELSGALRGSGAPQLSLQVGATGAALRGAW
jgi:hypothetical protein